MASIIAAKVGLKKSSGSNTYILHYMSTPAVHAAASITTTIVPLHALAGVEAVTAEFAWSPGMAGNTATPNRE